MATALAEAVDRNLLQKNKPTILRNQLLDMLLSVFIEALASRYHKAPSPLHIHPQINDRISGISLLHPDLRIFSARTVCCLPLTVSGHIGPTAA